MTYRGLDPTTDCLLPRIQELEALARTYQREIDPAALAWRPPDGGWGIAQIFEHLVIANRLYLERMRDLIEHAPASARAARPWRPSFVGRLLIRSLVPENERRLPTASKLAPAVNARDRVIDVYLETLQEIAVLLLPAQELDPRRLRMVSPVSRLARGLNLGDAFIILVVHAQRHMKQIERVLAHPAFPRGSTQSSG